MGTGCRFMNTSAWSATDPYSSQIEAERDVPDVSRLTQQLLVLVLASSTAHNWSPVHFRRSEDKTNVVE